jgi:hypothetical protein
MVWVAISVVKERSAGGMVYGSNSRNGFKIYFGSKKTRALLMG